MSNSLTSDKTDPSSSTGPAGSEGVMTAEQISDIKTKSVTGAISYFLKTALLQGIGLASAFILSAFFRPEDFGIYGYVTQIIGLLIFFSDIGLAASLVQKKRRPELKDYRTAFTVQQLLSWLIVLLVVVILATGLVQQKVGSAGQWILLALSLSFPLASLKTIPSIKLERKLEFSKLIIPQIFEQFVFHLILIYLAWQGMGAMAYSYAIIARSLIGVFVMYLIQPWSLGIAFDLASFKGLVKFGAKFQLNDFLARIKDQLFYLVLGSFLPLAQFGYIQWAKTWSMYPYNLTVQNVIAITFPTFSRLQKHEDLLAKAIEKSVFFISLFIFPILVGMSVFIYPLTQVIDKYQQWQPAVASFIMFTLSVGWSAISTPLLNTLNAVGKINKSLKLMVLWTGMTWILTPILVWKFGFNGVALGALIISFTSILSIILVNKIVNVQIWSNVKHQLLASLIMAGVGLAGIEIWSRGLKLFLAGGVISGLSYLTVLVLVSRKKLIAEIASLRN